MSIFDKFKKIFSGFDPFDDQKSQEEKIQERSLDKAAVDEYRAIQRESEILNSVNWKSVINQIFLNEDVQEIIQNLHDSYSDMNYNDIHIFLKDLSSGVDRIIEVMKKLNIPDFDYVLENVSNFKAQVADALLSVIAKSKFTTTYKQNSTKQKSSDADIFRNVFDPSLNNLSTLCNFISRFLIEYRKQPRVANNLIAPCFSSKNEVNKFIDDCYKIDVFVQNFRQTPYNDISDNDKHEFLSLVNQFKDTYSKNKLLISLNILIENERGYRPKVNTSTIGGTKGGL